MKRAHKYVMPVEIACRDIGFSLTDVNDAQATIVPTCSPVCPAFPSSGNPNGYKVDPSAISELTAQEKSATGASHKFTTGTVPPAVSNKQPCM